MNQDQLDEIRAAIDARNSIQAGPVPLGQDESGVYDLMFVILKFNLQIDIVKMLWNLTHQIVYMKYTE